MKKYYLYWIIPILAWLLQLFMSLNSFNQLRFEEFIESVQAPFWLDNRLIISGLHVNVGWYGLLLIVYKIFGFSLLTGKIINLVASFVSTFMLFYLLKKFFDWKIASVILGTIVLSPTLLYMNAVSLHWAMTFHLMVMILGLLYVLDFKKRKQSFFLTGVIFLLMIVTWFFYQAVVFYIPSLVIFYWMKLKQYNGYNNYKNYNRYILIAAVAFLLPLMGLFAWVQNEQAPSGGSRNILVVDSEVGGGLFRGGGSFVFSEQVFSQAWTNFLSDFFIKGVSHHYEVYLAEFSLIFPVITLAFVFIMSFRLLKYKGYKDYKFYILLALLVVVFDIVVFSTTADLGMPGMKRVTPMLFSIYFLWIVVWYYLMDPRFHHKGTNFFEVSRGDDKWRKVGMVLLSLLTIHHLSVYPINLAHLKDPSPFKVTDWFDETNPQKSVDQYTQIARKQDLVLDCRQQLREGGSCFYDFIFPAVAGSCKWNHLDCYQILGYDPESGKFKELGIEYLNKHEE